jgi:hypothetical protein
MAVILPLHFGLIKAAPIGEPSFLIKEVIEMSHITIYFLTPAEDFEDAISRVETHLECEKEFADGFDILRNKSGTLVEKMNTLCNLRSGQDSITLAEKYLADAETRKQEGFFGQAGHYYHCAGLLYEGALTQDMPVYNIDSFDYAIPLDTRGWFCIAAYFYL